VSQRVTNPIDGPAAATMKSVAPIRPGLNDALIVRSVTRGGAGTFQTSPDATPRPCTSQPR